MIPVTHITHNPHICSDCKRQKARIRALEAELSERTFMMREFQARTEKAEAERDALKTRIAKFEAALVLLKELENWRAGEKEAVD